MKKSKGNGFENLSAVDLLTQMIREGAVGLVAQAMEAEVGALLEAVSERLSDGKRRLVRNGHLPERKIMTGIGELPIKVPRVRDRGDGCDKISFQSAWIPPYMRGTATLEKVLPLLYLKGISEAAFVIAMDDGFRESTESGLPLLRNLKDRGFEAPCIAVGYGALGFWNAVTEVFPQTKHQRCWFHKMANVLDKLPKSLQPRAKSMLHEIWMSPTKDTAYAAYNAFIAEYKAKYPKAAECLEKDIGSLLTFYDFPAEHWVHLRTTNPIESTFATVRNRTYKVKGAFSSKTIVTMTFKLMQSAEKTWIRQRGFHHLDNVIKGVEFKDGKMQENESICSNNEELIRKAA